MASGSNWIRWTRYDRFHRFIFYILKLCGVSYIFYGNYSEPVLFNDTIAKNIAYGFPAASREDIEKAAKLANAHEFIVSFPSGYDTPVGERGTQLSGKDILIFSLVINRRLLMPYYLYLKSF